MAKGFLKGTTPLLRLGATAFALALLGACIGFAGFDMGSKRRVCNAHADVA